MTKLSYLIPAYNHENYIDETLNSISKDCKTLVGYQYEIVIIDDGSTDKTNENIKIWISNNSELNIVYSSRSNCGLTRTLNELIDVSKGEFLRLCSSDDSLIPGSSLEFIQVLKENRDLYAVFGNAKVINETGKILFENSIEYHHGDIDGFLDKERIKQTLIEKWSIAGPSCIVKKDFYKKHYKYDPEMVIDDWDMYLKLAAMESIQYVNLFACKYRLHASNTSKTTNRRKRILNLKSQLVAIDRNYSIFDTYHKRLFKKNKYLIKAKISFLSYNILSLALNMSVFFILSLIVRVKK